MIHLRNPDEMTLRHAVNDLLSGVRNRTSLAKQLGIHRTTLYKWETGESRPLLPVLAQMCQILGQQVRIDLGPEIEEDDTLTMLRRILDQLENPS